jgi:hypothetical protein
MAGDRALDPTDPAVRQFRPAGSGHRPYGDELGEPLVDANHVEIALATYTVASLVWSAGLLSWSLLDVLGRRADCAVDEFILRVGPSGWGSLIVFPLTVNVGSSMLVAGVVSASAAIRSGDEPWLGYALAIGGLLVAIGVPVWASQEIKDPDRRAIAPQIYDLKHEFSESTRTTVLASIARERSKVQVKADTNYGRRFRAHVIVLVLGVAAGIGSLSQRATVEQWVYVGFTFALVVAALVVRGPMRHGSLARSASVLSGYEVDVQVMAAPTPVPPVLQNHYHQHGATQWPAVAATLLAVTLGNYLGRRRR